VNNTTDQQPAPQSIIVRHFDPARFLALVRKESLQAMRDPSTLLIALVLPLILLFLFAYAVSLDIRHVRIGVVLESPGAVARTLAEAFSGTLYLDVRRILNDILPKPVCHWCRLLPMAHNPIPLILLPITRRASSRPGRPISLAPFLKRKCSWSRVTGSTPSWPAGVRWYRAPSPSS